MIIQDYQLTLAGSRGCNSSDKCLAQPPHLIDQTWPAIGTISEVEYSQCRQIRAEIQQ